MRKREKEERESEREFVDGQATHCASFKNKFEKYTRSLRPVQEVLPGWRTHIHQPIITCTARQLLRKPVHLTSASPYITLHHSTLFHFAFPWGGGKGGGSSNPLTICLNIFYLIIMQLVCSECLLTCYLLCFLKMLGFLFQ